MRVFRFDEEASVPAPHAGSRLRIARVAGDGADVEVEVVYVGATGHVALPPAGRRRFLGVVAGHGRVTAPDGHGRDLRSGYGIVLEPGESAEVGSGEGLTAIRIEGGFEPEALAVTQEIVVSEYDPEWPDWFSQIKDRLWPVVAPVAARIDHVGSTSVPGLAAKPVIDMDVVVTSPARVTAVIERLEQIGYTWQGDVGVAGRESLRPPAHLATPRHHLYVVVEDNKAHLDHWLLRDLLRADPAARERYASLKRRNQKLARGDMDFYVAAKAALVAELLARAREERGLPAATYWDPDLPGLT
jgi:GrpB-like predicted nucleotidyltransferase (UPF0157 family)